MKRVDVSLGERGYAIAIGTGLIDEAGLHLAPFARDGRLIVVSDGNVWPALGERLTGALARAGLKAVPMVVAAGEASKSWPTLIGLVERLVELGVERGDHILAFGGGMVGDLAGFAAAITKRGIGHVQMPTSLLAQVDSSVGGKTAINVSAGKNLAGAFHQPSAVLIDPLCLDTLPGRELRAGYAEIVKYGLIGNPTFFAWCEENGEKLLQGDVERRFRAIETSVRAKAAIVAEDERETTGRRALLNLGHTFAHALEAETGFSDRLLHGEAVAIGMTLAFRFSLERGLCPEADAERVETHLVGVGFPARLCEIEISAPGERLTAHMASDKKMSGGCLSLILTKGIGAAYIERGVGLPEIAAFLNSERRR